MNTPNLTDLNLAYETGFHIGDGSMGIYNNGKYVIAYFGNNLTERNFFEKIISPLVKQLYDINAKVNSFENTCFIRIFSKELVSFKHKIIGLPLGPKSKIIFLPRKIISQGKTHISYIVAGIFDSDGCVKLIKRINGLYPRLKISMKNKTILREIQELLKKFDISSTVYEETRYDKRVQKFITYSNLEINGFKNLQKFLLQIPIRNPHHLHKLKVLFQTKRTDSDFNMQF